MHNVPMCEYSSLPQAIDILRPELSRDDRDFAAWQAVRDDPATYFACIPLDIIHYKIAPMFRDKLRRYTIADAIAEWNLHRNLCIALELQTDTSCDEYPPGNKFYKYASGIARYKPNTRMNAMFPHNNNPHGIRLIDSNTILVVCRVNICIYTLATALDTHAFDAATLIATYPNTYIGIFHAGGGNIIGTNYIGYGTSYVNIVTGTIYNWPAHCTGAEILPCGLFILLGQNDRYLADPVSGSTVRIPADITSGFIDDTGTPLAGIKPFHAKQWSTYGSLIPLDEW